MKNSYLLFVLITILITFAFSSCKEIDNPRAVIKVVETIDSLTVPVYGALVEVGPATNENILDDVQAQGYTNSSGVIEFEFTKKLILTAKASKIERDENGSIIYNENGQIIISKTNSTIITLDYDYTDSKTIIVD